VDSYFTSKSQNRIQRTKASKFIKSTDDFVKRVWKRGKVITAKHKKSKSVSKYIKTITSLDKTEKVTSVEALKRVTDVVVELLKTTLSLKQKLND